MIKRVAKRSERNEEIIRLGKEGKRTIQEVAKAWDTTPENIADYLHRLQDQKGYAYLVDGNGYFRIFQEIE